MNRIIFAGFLLCAVISAFAEQYSPQVIKIYDEEEVSQLEEEGAQILRRRGDILLCLIPTGNDNEIVIPNSSRKVRVKGKAGETGKESDMGDVGKVGKGGKVDDVGNGGKRDFSGFNVPTLDAAIAHFDASDIIYGKGFDHAYTGKDIVVGICDIGFDPLHPTFLDEEGKSRVKRVTQYKEREGIRLQLEGDKQYAEWGTDDPDNYHATHVCGILAGNGGGTPYVGIARDADIVVSTSTLTDVGLLAGVEDIIDYAKEVGKPAVINLSMGNYTGAHDGTSLFSQYLDMCADDAVIVLSSGNEGYHTNYLGADFTDQKPEIGFRLGNKKWDQIDMYGITDIWGSDSSPLAVEISIFDEDTHKIVYTYPSLSLEGYDAMQIVWNPDQPVFDGCPLDGYLIVTMGVDPENERSQAMLLYDFECSEKVSGGWAKYVLAVKVTGTPGTYADIFSDGTYTRLTQLSGYPKPNTEMSVSDLACGHRTISVGMYGNPWPDQFVPYSSYGTLRDGRILPLTVAPGYSLVSSGSRPYFTAHPDAEHMTYNGAPWLLEGGTSMSAPYVAGFIATWLEANPYLSPEDIQRIIKATNRTDIPDPEDPHNGQGWFDPKAGILSVINEAGIESIETPDNIDPEEEVRVYSIDGRLVYEGKAKGCRNLDKGIYILNNLKFKM